MKRINLKDFYPFYEEDCYVDVPDELAALMQEYERQERAYTEKTRYHKAYYSLERDPSLEKSVRYVSMSPEEIYERKLTMNELYAAMSTLPEMQARRIYAHYFLGMSKSEIAKVEGTNIPAIGKSIERGLKQVGKFLKKTMN